MGGVWGKKAETQPAALVNIPFPLWAELQHFRALWRNTAIRKDHRTQGLFHKRYLELAAVIGSKLDANFEPRKPAHVDGEELWKVLAPLPETFDWVTADDFSKIVACLFEPVQAVSSEEGKRAREATAKAFNNTHFHSTTEYVDLFKKTLGSYALLWKVGNHYAPMTSVVNASMSGKSRMLKEVPELGVFCFLMCTRPATEADLPPPRTPFVADFLTSELTGARTEAVFQENCEMLFVRLLAKLADWLATQELKRTGTGEERLKQLTVAWFKHTQSGNFWTEDLCKPKTTSEEDWAGAEERVKAQLSKLMRGQLDQEKLHVLFIVDEAKAMVIAKTFLRFRRATQIFPKASSLNTFCVVTDTTSTVANFNPADQTDFSELDSQAGTQTFAPFTLVMSLDAWWLAAKNLRCDPAVDEAAVMEMVRTALIEGKSPKKRPRSTFEDRMTMSLLKSFEVMSFFGRPGYFGFHHFTKGNPGEDPRGMQIRLLQSKLLRAPVELVKAKKIAVSLEAAVAVLGSLVSIEISASSKLAADLASGHLRLVGAISIDRHLVYTLEIPEPVMAIAAHDLINSGVLTWTEIMDAFFRAEISNSTMVGYRGEVAAQILFLMAWQKCLADRFPDADSKLDFPAVPVLDFLEALFGELEIKDATREKLKRGLIRLYQIVKIIAEPSNELLYQSFIRGCGIHCKEGQKAIDNVFAIFYPEPTQTPKKPRTTASPETSTAGLEHAPVTRADIRDLCVQIKLEQGNQSPRKKAQWEAKMSELPLLSERKSDPKKPSVAIFLELGGDKEAPLEIKDDDAQIVFYKRGLSVKHFRPDLGDAVDAAFRRLIESQADISTKSTVSADQRPYVRKMFKAFPYCRFEDGLPFH